MPKDVKKLEWAQVREQQALTRELQANRSKQDVEDKFRLFVDAVKDYAIITLTPEGEIDSWNAGAEHLLGYKSEEVLYESVRTLYSGNPECPFQAMSYADKHGRKIVEGWRIRKDGTKFWANTITTAVFSPDNNLHGYSEVTQDLTERRNNEQKLIDMNLNLEKLVQARTAELEAANKELEAFSYSVSHDLQAPLRSIDGFAKILVEDFADKFDPAIMRNLEVISKNALKMRQLIEDLLEFSRLSRQPLDTKIIDLTPIAYSVIAELKRDQLDDVPITLSVLNGLPAAVCDEALIRQVFVNLFSNAIKFSKSKGKIEIKVGGTTGDQENTYFVKDDGVGFDTRYINKLFGPFQRLHSTKDYQGNGIGLALVQRIIRRHGGRVWAESELNESATFTFTLPNKEVNQ
jgi:PAS domain S-box-containing protein